jgi:hypothetical protein
MKRRVVRGWILASVVVGTWVGGIGTGAAAPPAAATLLAPSGLLPSGSVTFTWQAVTGATFYYLHVNDATAGPRFTAWYPAGQACPADSATCAATVTTGWAVGAGIWWIQTWNPDGLGAWSAGMAFTVRWVAGSWDQQLAATDRFQLVYSGDAVLDRETGLIWRRSLPDTVATWDFWLHACLSDGTGGRRGWRLPSHEELSSLVDITQANPALPAGHPFGNVKFGSSDYYWTATTYPSNSAQAYTVWFGMSGSPLAPKVQSHGGWCVRGGTGTDNPR